MRRTILLVSASILVLCVVHSLPAQLPAVPRGARVRVTFENGRAKQKWEIPSLNLSFTATMAGGSRTDCESWYLLLEPIDKTS